jgi:hypothetical protein
LIFDLIIFFDFFQKESNFSNFLKTFKVCDQWLDVPRLLLGLFFSLESFSVCCRCLLMAVALP